MVAMAKPSLCMKGVLEDYENLLGIKFIWNSCLLLFSSSTNNSTSSSTSSIGLGLLFFMVNILSRYLAFMLFISIPSNLSNAAITIGGNNI